MQTHTRQAALAIGLFLVCAATTALAQSPKSQPKTLWSLLGIPQIGSKMEAPAAKRRPTRNMASQKRLPVGKPAESSQNDQPSSEIEDAQSNDDVIGFSENYGFAETESSDSATQADNAAANRSSRRSAILKRESARGETNVASTTARPPPVNPPPLTPHWIPPQVDESVLLQPNTRERSVRPVAVNVSGELLSERVPLTVAVARLDGTFGITSSAIRRAAYRLDEADDEVSSNVDRTPEVPIPALISAAQSSPVSLHQSLR